MNYQTILENAMEWFFSDPIHIGFVIGAIVVIGAANGIRLSLGRCTGRYNGRIL